MKLLLMTRSLNAGGAERQLINLAGALVAHGVEVHVAIFYGGGRLENELADSESVRLHRLGKEGRWDLLRFGFRLRSFLARSRFDVVYSLLPGPSLAALLGRTIRKRPGVVWGVRATETDYSHYPWIMRAEARIHRRLSGLADYVIVNSKAALGEWRRHGVSAIKLRHVANGIDTDRFHPSPEARDEARKQLGLSRSSGLVGIVGRIDPKKDHGTFLRAAALLLKRRDEARFVCIGGVSGGMESYAQALRRLDAELGLDGLVHWLGDRPDVSSLLPAMDVLTTSSSFGEGFPNVVGEAMASGVPCVVTDVGDSAYVVGDAGTIVPPRDPEALASAWDRTLALSAKQRERLCASAQTRVKECFSVERMATETLNVLELAAFRTGNSR